MKNKMLTIVGVLALALAIGLNVRHALNDYGVKDGKLHVEVLAQASGTSGGSSSGSGSSGGGSNADKEGPKTNLAVTCEISGTLSHSTTNNNSSESFWGFSGGFKVNGILKPVIDINANGEFDKKDANGNSLYNTGSISIKETVSGNSIMCQRLTTDKCTPWDPCIEKLKEYRTLFE